MKNSSSWDEQDNQFPPPSHPVFQGIRELEEKNEYRRPPYGSQRLMERRFGSVRPVSSRWDGPWSSYRGYREYEEEERESSRIVAQVIGAAVLVVIAYVAFHSSHPLAVQAQQAIRTVMTKETDFSPVKNWIASHFGNGYLSIPASTSGSKPAIESISYVSPLADYKIATDYNADKHPAVILQTAPGSDVKTVTKGQVKTFDKNEKYGIYVVVDHGAAGQTLYGHLESVTVKPGDWLYTGQTIGKTAKKDPSDLYFAYFVNQQAVDPKDILEQAGRQQ